MKHLLAILCVLAVALSAEAQQLPQFTQYFMNDYAFNPAVAGVRERIEVRSNNRYQWEGITDAPRTYTLSLNLPVADDRLGVGGNLFTDIVGPTRRIGVQLGGAYHLPISDNTTLGFGFSVGMLEYVIDGQKIELATTEGETALMNLGKTRVVDAMAGVYLNAENYYVGFSVPQFTKSNVDVFTQNISGASTLVPHYYLTGGYQFEINEDFSIEPNFLLKYVAPIPVKYDINLRGIYRNMVWIGASYRNEDAVAAMVGVKLNEKLFFGYSHDFSTSEIKSYTTGTHEIMLGLNISRPQ